MTAKPKISGAGLAIGLGLIAIALVIGIDTMQMQVPPTYARVGPQVFPYLIAIGLGFTGVVASWQALKGEDDGSGGENTGPTDWKGLGIIAVGLIAHMNLLKPLGFVIAGTILFLSVAFAFGSRRYLRDVIVAFAMTLTTYVGFTYGLGLPLPPGLLKGIF